MFFSPNLFVTATQLIVLFIISLIFFYYLYYQYCFNYWKKKGVPQLNPSFPIGDLGSSILGKQSVYIRLQNLYHQFKDAGHKFGGIYFFNGPLFMPIDPEIVKKILVTDFDHFVDRGMYLNEEKLPMSSHLLSMKGKRWRNMRTKFTPTFTSGKMKSMYKILLTHFQSLTNTLEPMAQREEEVDMKEILMRVTTDIIGTTAFGVDINTLKEPNSEFAKMVAMIFNAEPWKLFKLAIEEGLQNPGNFIKIGTENKIMTQYFTDLVTKTVEYRDKNNVFRDDFLNLLMQLRSSGMSMQEVVSQSVLLFIAGFETSSSTMSNSVHELALHQDLQDKLRKEIHEKLGRDSSKYTYEDVLALPYLDKVIKETLRKYPPVAMLNRVCVKPYQIPGTDIVIDKDTLVIISTLGLHRDPDFFENPLDYDPERFSSDRTVVPYTYLPFGEGPRNCIGLRFGIMQTKLGLATMINDYIFYPTDKSPKHLEINPFTTTIVLSILNGVQVKIVKVVD